jgi:sulfate/thiosulfate-binding protein
MRRLVLLLLAIPLVAACGSAGPAQQSTSQTATNTTLSLIAYSTPQPVMKKLIAQWQSTPAGKGVSFTQSYGSSGSQARAVVAGQPCDIAFLSTGLDIDSLAAAGVVPKAWPSQPDGGIVADSVVAFVVRPGNPKHIHSWADLVKPGVKVVTPDPFSSGSAKWNVLAAYGAQRKLGKTDAEAQAYVKQLFGHVVSQDSSGSSAMSTFLAGQGDVLLTYESEAYAAQASGEHLSIVIPQQTMLIELPMVATANAPTAAKAFITYAHTPAAQAVFAENGYRPVVASVLQQPALATWRQRYSTTGKTIFPISDPLFGGWTKASRVWFAANTGRMLAIERAVGGPTS